jgi:methionine biosynthesis protein MetW
MTLRADLALVADLVMPGSRVLDLGCDTGTLLSHLAAEKRCSGTGVEIDGDAALVAIRSGVSVIDLDMDHQLSEFADHSYDVVVLSRTLQTLHRPHVVLQEMIRIAPRVILSMPNFGYWRNRIRLARGRMPMSKELPYDWYDTPNLHHATLVDLEDLFRTVGLVALERIPLTVDGHRLSLPESTATWAAGSAVYVLGGV